MSARAFKIWIERQERHGHLHHETTGKDGEDNKLQQTGSSSIISGEQPEHPWLEMSSGGGDD